MQISNKVSFHQLVSITTIIIREIYLQNLYRLVPCWLISTDDESLLFVPRVYSSDDYL